MKEIIYFYLRGCPYCKKADRMIEELIDENSEFAQLDINKIEESDNSELAGSYDYYYVPCLWIGDKKMHEGIPTKEKIRDVFIAALDK